MSQHIQSYDSGFYPAMPVVDIQVQREIDEVSISLTAIVGSGADSTMLPTAILEQLSVAESEKVWMVTVGGQRTAVLLYWVFVRLGTFQPIYTQGVGTPSRDEVIIGRDVINQFAVLLNGPASTIEISA